jgi:hypothetical protein
MPSNDQNKREYVGKHIDDPDLCARIPDYKRRLHELERQFLAGKMRDDPKPKRKPKAQGKPAAPVVETTKDGELPSAEQEAAADKVLDDARSGEKVVSGEKADSADSAQ